MGAVVREARTGRGVRAALVVGALVVAPLLLAAPAYADTTSPTPIASETSGGATCLPGTSATCGQDQGVTPTPTATPTAAVTTLPNTGGSKPTSTLAHTGGGAATGWGYTGTGLLVGGSLLVLVAGRRRPAQD